MKLFSTCLMVCLVGCESSSTRTFTEKNFSCESPRGLYDLKITQVSNTCKFGAVPVTVEPRQGSYTQLFPSNVSESLLLIGSDAKYCVTNSHNISENKCSASVMQDCSYPNPEHRCTKLDISGWTQQYKELMQYEHPDGNYWCVTRNTKASYLYTIDIKKDGSIDAHRQDSVDITGDKCSIDYNLTYSKIHE